MYYVYKLGNNGMIIREETENNSNKDIDEQNTLEMLYIEQQNRQPQGQANANNAIDLEKETSINAADELIKLHFHLPLISRATPYEDTMSDEQAIETYKKHMIEYLDLIQLSEKITTENIKSINDYFMKTLKIPAITIALANYREGMYSVIFMMLKAGLKPTQNEINLATSYLRKEITDLFNFKESLDNLTPSQFFQNQKHKTAGIYELEKTYDALEGTVVVSAKEITHETLTETQKDEKMRIQKRLSAIHRNQPVNRMSIQLQEQQKPLQLSLLKQQLQVQHLQLSKPQPQPQPQPDSESENRKKFTDMVKAGKKDKNLLESHVIKNYSNTSDHSIITELLYYGRTTIITHLINTYPNMTTTNIGMPHLNVARSLDAQNLVLNILKRQPQFNLNETDLADGNTVLHRLVIRNYGEDSVKNLLENGANATIKNKYGETAIDLAKRLDHKKLVKILTDHVQKTQAKPVSTLEGIKQSISRQEENLEGKMDEKEKLTEEINNLVKKINQLNEARKTEEARLVAKEEARLAAMEEARLAAAEEARLAAMEAVKLAAIEEEKLKLNDEEKELLEQLSTIRKQKEKIDGKGTESSVSFSNNAKRIKLTKDNNVITNKINQGYNDGSHSLQTGKQT